MATAGRDGLFAFDHGMGGFHPGDGLRRRILQAGFLFRHGRAVAVEAGSLSAGAAEGLELGAQLLAGAVQVTLALFGVKNLHIHEYICEDAWLRQSDPGGVCPAIRLSDDAGNSPCDGIYIYGGRLAKNNAFSRVNCLIENQSTDARNVYVNWRNFELPSGVAGYVENGQTTNTQDV